MTFNKISYNVNSFVKLISNC